MGEAANLQALKGIRFFHNISDAHLARLAEIARELEFPAQRTIFREHDEAKDVYVVISGRVSLVFCQPKLGCRQLMDVGDGELIGWSPLIGRHRLSDTAHTMAPTRVLALDAEKVLALCKEEPEFGFDFMHRVAHVLGQRLTATRMRLLEMGGFHLPEMQIESD